MHQLKVAVYITSYNQRAYLKEAIDSVLTQTRLPDEIIIVDDASTDGSRELIEDYHIQYPKLVKPLFHKSNQGVSRTRNDALQMVASDLVTNLDGDDRFLPEKIENEVALLEQDISIDLVYSNYINIDNHGMYINTWATDECLPQGNILGAIMAYDFPPYVERVDMKTLFSTADVLSLHTPLNDETRNIVNGHVLDLMKPGSYLVNTRAVAW